MAIALPAGAVAVVSARTGPDTSEPIVATARIAGARMVRLIRMTASMRQPGSAASELDLAANPRHEFPYRSSPAFD
jgi:hypothetical protein